MATKSLAILGSRGIPAKYGGFETFAEQIAVRLAAQDFVVTVYCEDQGQDRLREYHGVKLCYVSVPRCGPLTTILFDLRCLWFARKTYDVVYMLGYGASPFCFIPRIWGTAVWINMDGIEWARSKWSKVAKLYLRFCEAAAMWTPTRIVADAAGIREHLRSRHRRMPPCSVIPYGAMIVDKAPDPSPLAGFHVEPFGYYLIVCRLEPENHIVEIVQGYIASSSTRPLIIFGDVNIDTPYVRTLTAHEDARIRFAGTLFDQPSLESMRWYCRAYFHGHSVGGTNPSLIEAMGCGNRIIAHDNVFNREVTADHARFFRTANDIPGIIDDIDAVELREDDRHGPIARIRSDYSWPGIANTYASLLRQDF